MISDLNAIPAHTGVAFLHPYSKIIPHAIESHALHLANAHLELGLMDVLFRSLLHPGQHALSSRVRGGEGAREKVAARRSIPIHHFTSNENTLRATHALP